MSKSCLSVNVPLKQDWGKPASPASPLSSRAGADAGALHRRKC